MHLYYAFGYYKEEEPLFQTEECVIVIDNNLLNEISVSENLYNILEKVDEFTLSPVLAFIQDEKRQCSLGVHGCIQEPLNGKAYGAVNAKMINAPFIEYSPLAFECRITDRKKEVYGSYISTKICAEIVNTIAYKSIVIDGEVDVVKLFGLKGLYTKPF